MIIGVVGLGHLGTTTAACLATKHMVIAYDASPAFALDSHAKEPGATSYLADGFKSKHLQLTSDKQRLKDATVIWITYDTPVDNNDNAGFEVFCQIVDLMSIIRDGVPILVSSQLPVGTVRRLELAWATAGRKTNFACVPENLRRGKAVDTFMNPDRIVVGVRDSLDGVRLRAFLSGIWPFNRKVSVESAEMTKHALNAFLATSIVFANEIAAICKRTGADPIEVERGLRTDQRVGPRAYVRGGEAFTGGTLARDLRYLQNMSDGKFFHAVYDSNQEHLKK
jgi:UDPglucose 6-dehydrogenase